MLDNVRALFQRILDTNDLPGGLEESYDSCKRKGDLIDLGMLSPAMLVMIAHFEQRLAKLNPGGEEGPPKKKNKSLSSLPVPFESDSISWSGVEPGTDLMYSVRNGDAMRKGKFVSLVGRGRIEVETSAGTKQHVFSKRAKLDG